ncbi:MAG: hypothetical protein IIC82_00680 [Chloroflexi bacterium]|nr:hypothetical protein [Chloroflexota bacterium]
MSISNLPAILRRVQKPGRYVDSEWNAVTKDWDSAETRVVICYPDTYEEGMASFELQALYRLVNDQPAFLAQRAFVPWDDMAMEMRQAGVPLYGLEGRRSVADFDVLAVCFDRLINATNLVELLDLGGLPVSARERGVQHPIVVGIGSRIVNWEPIADMLDIVLLGEPEDALLEILERYARSKTDVGASRPPREDFLARAATFQGVYVPTLYGPCDVGNGSSARAEPVCKRVPAILTRRIARELGPALINPVLPYLEIRQDRGVVVVARDCGGTCADCRNGNPCPWLRQRRVEEGLEAIEGLVARCGYQEIALLAPSSAEYGSLLSIAEAVRSSYPPEVLSLVLPSLDVGPAEAQTIAATDVLLASARRAMELGGQVIRYHATLGRPDVEIGPALGIVDLVIQTTDLGQRLSGRRPRVRVELEHFVPRPGAMTECLAQLSLDEVTARQAALRKALKKVGVQVSGADPAATFVEAALLRGNRRTGDVIRGAWALGATFQGHAQRFEVEKWTKSFREAGIDPAFALPSASSGDALPWSHLVGDPGTGDPTAGHVNAAVCAQQPCPVCATFDGTAGVNSDSLARFKGA